LIFVVLARNENTKRARWRAIFLVNGRLDGYPICDQNGSDLVVLVLNKTSQNERQLFGYSHALEAHEKHISYFLLI
jgi:hypothetical protein